MSHQGDSSTNTNKSSQKSIMTLESNNNTTYTNQHVFSIGRFLVHYNRFIASSANQDKGLKLLQWTLWLFSRLYPNRKSPLMKSSFDISFARYLLRFYGFPTTLEAIVNNSWEDGKTPLGGVTGKLMAWAMLGYYPLEHIAYIRWTSPDLLPQRFNANKYSSYSCRFWLVYLLAEMTQSILRLRRLYREHEVAISQQQQQQQQQQGAEMNQGLHPETTDGTLLMTLHQSIRNEQLQLARSSLFTLPCLHWSLPKWDTDPWLSDGVCNGLMWLESVVSMYQAIRNYSLSAMKV